MRQREALRAWLLAMADDDLILGHRHSEWTGFAPDIESDVAMSSISQDEIGHARLLYEQVGTLDDTSPDGLAYGRTSRAFRNAVLVERDDRELPIQADYVGVKVSDARKAGEKVDEASAGRPSVAALTR